MSCTKIDRESFLEVFVKESAIAQSPCITDVASRDMFHNGMAD